MRLAELAAGDLQGICMSLNLTIRMDSTPVKQNSGILDSNVSLLQLAWFPLISGIQIIEKRQYLPVYFSLQYAFNCLYNCIDYKGPLTFLGYVPWAQMYCSLPTIVSNISTYFTAT